MAEPSGPLVFIIVLVSIAFSLLITTPFSGTLVRYRANYNPKGVQLDGEGGAQAQTGPIVRSYFAMMSRVKRLEGWAGLYKGIMPQLATSLVVALFISLLPSASLTGNRSKYSTPDAEFWAIMKYGVFMVIISLPVVIITNRAITTPYKLPWFNPKFSLRVLLTPHERRKPWTLYLTPGLLLSEFASLAFVLLILHPTRRAIFPTLSKTRPGDGFPKDDFTFWRTLSYTLLSLFGTLVLSPLEVISTRLSIQRNYAGQNVEEEPVLDVVEFSANDEDVIGLRPEDDPYDSFVDCAKRISQEEGYETFYRAAWLQLLGLLLGGL